MGIRLILDTDIGSDIDDAWALALCLASQEIELLGVTLVHADLETRAKIALKMLKLAKRAQTPVYKGLSKPLTRYAQVYWGGHEGDETDFSDIEGLSVPDGAVDFILDTVQRFPNEVVVCPVGPLTNIGEAIRRKPDVMRGVKRLVIMGSTFEGEGEDAAATEHNVRVDSDATRIVFESMIPATVVGLNVTRKVLIREEDLKSIESSAFGRYLAHMTRGYYRVIGREQTCMHDPLTVATLLDPGVVRTERMSARVLDGGRIAFTRDPEGPLDVAVDVDARRFENLLVSRIYELTQKGD